MKHISMRMAHKEDAKRLMKVLFLPEPKLSNQMMLCSNRGAIIKPITPKTSEAIAGGPKVIKK